MSFSHGYSISSVIAALLVVASVFPLGWYSKPADVGPKSAESEKESAGEKMLFSDSKSWTNGENILFDFGSEGAFSLLQLSETHQLVDHRGAT